MDITHIRRLARLRPYRCSLFVDRNGDSANLLTGFHRLKRKAGKKSVLFGSEFHWFGFHTNSDGTIAM
jgi:hypothetical protein